MGTYPVGATATTFEIIDVLSEVEDGGVTEIAERLDLSKGSAYNHLATLEELGYVVREDGRYRLSLRFLDLGARVRDTQDAYHVARSAVDRLAHSSGEVASLVVKEGGEAVFVYRAGDDETSQLREGSRVPLHACAAGKAILASRSSDAEDELPTDPAAPTDETITDPETLVRELQTVRDQGLAFDRGELFTDRRAVAAPIATNDGHVVGAIAISGSPDRMSGKRLEEDMPGLVLSTANKVAVDRITE